jgi:hypothetical protein
MPHMVIFRSDEGKPGYHQIDSLEDALRFVERLRNHEQVTGGRIYRLTEVPIEFKAYYKVEVAGVAGVDEAVVPAPPEGVVPVTVGAPDETVEEPVASHANGASRFGRFNRA